MSNALLQIETEEYPAPSSSDPVSAGRTANAIIDALGQFFITPSVSNKVAAIVAMQAYLAEVEQHVHARRTGMRQELSAVPCTKS